MNLIVDLVGQLAPGELKRFLAAADESPDGLAAEGRRVGAVLAVFLSAPAGGPAVLLTRRAVHLEEHPGQISFPGGAAEPGDADLWATALREAWEEVGLKAEELEFLGRRPPQPVRDRWLIHPHLAWWPQPRPLRPDPAEVAGIILAPLVDLARQHQPDSWRSPDPGSRYLVGGEVLWGATASILARLIDRLGLELAAARGFHRSATTGSISGA